MPHLCCFEHIQFLVCAHGKLGDHLELRIPGNYSLVQIESRNGHCPKSNESFGEKGYLELPAMCETNTNDSTTITAPAEL